MSSCRRYRDTPGPLPCASKRLKRPKTFGNANCRGTCLLLLQDIVSRLEFGALYVVKELASLLLLLLLFLPPLAWSGELAARFVTL